MRITPQWVGTFETGLKGLIDDTSERITRNLIWDKFMDVQQSRTGKELYFFLIEAAQIRDEGQGGNKRFDDLAAHYFEIKNKNSGDGLRLSKNEIEDNQMANGAFKGMPVLDFASSWARQIGASSTRWPQDKLFELLGLGETQAAYDGVAFFAKNHPIHIFNDGMGTYANLFTGAAASTPNTDPQDAAYPGAAPIDDSVTLDVAADNFAKVVAYIEGIKGPNGKPRNLRVKYALAGTGLRKRLYSILDTKFLTQNGIENVVSKYGIEPEIATELGATSKEYYLFCELVPGGGGGLIYQNREDYALSSYGPMTEALLQRIKQFEWDYDGRNGASFGHPYLVFKVKAT